MAPRRMAGRRRLPVPLKTASLRPRWLCYSRSNLVDPPFPGSALSRRGNPRNAARSLGMTRVFVSRGHVVGVHANNVQRDASTAPSLIDPAARTTLPRRMPRGPPLERQVLPPDSPSLDELAARDPLPERLRERPRYDALPSHDPHVPLIRFQGSASPLTGARGIHFGCQPPAPSSRLRRPWAGSMIATPSYSSASLASL